MEASFWDGKRASGLTDHIDFTQYESVIQAIEEAFVTYADRPAFTSLGYTLSFAQIDKYSAAFAHYLQNHTSLLPGDAIAIQMLNTLQYPIAVYGALRAGLRIVNTNPLYTEREMVHQFNDSGAKALLCMDVFAKSVENIQAETSLELILISSLADMLPSVKRLLINSTVKHIKKMVPKYHLPQAISFRKVVNQSLGKGFNPTHLSQPDDTIVLQYTGGTTGVAKSAELTNANIVANMLQSGTVTMQTDENGKALMGADKQSIMVAPLPLYHIYSFTVHLMAFFRLGEHSVLIANPRDTETFIKAIMPFKMTGLMGLNTLFVSLMESPNFKQLDFSEMVFTLSGGTALLDDTAERWKQITGIGISEAYGLTECSPAVCMNPFDGQERLGSVGQALPGTSLKCINAIGDEVAIGERGELCVKGPQVMKGYWNRPKATRESFTPGGEWLLTGDIAIIDEDGYVSIVDRVKDMIIVSGFNVFPNEIEGIVATHPDVLNCAAIGVPDPKQGEVIKLYIVTQNNVTLTGDDIKAFCKDKLTGYKIPRIYEFRKELPMSPVGKILRRELKEESKLEKLSA
ncbi:AMP-binding protein [Shewanella sp. D64]|uniref:AMP-binding protein n=1 Tax=unclassified Shewanella TaxID=196818 RepID=UPI0022BA4376|nr:MULTISPECIES: AMP-binding protein [unclassified Shewanella]MEC4724708.1 AMP-binding protein [Shewanella sp. D64]MEC4736498.1 AMP-binding protein [Shewanella sp. E94]WBJ97448.1 AMP-binding protein [Shewanella sp. MTB7]